MCLLLIIIRHIHKIVTDEQGGIQSRHENKIKSWSERQDRPISDTTYTVKLIGDVQRPPSYVMETLKLGPRNPVMTEFKANEVLCEMDLFLEYCEAKDVDDDMVNELNMLTYRYIKQAKQTKTPGQRGASNSSIE